METMGKHKYVRYNQLHQQAKDVSGNFSHRFRFLSVVTSYYIRFLLFISPFFPLDLLLVSVSSFI
jgi:hypothetical protein